MARRAEVGSPRGWYSYSAVVHHKPDLVQLNNSWLVSRSRSRDGGGEEEEEQEEEEEEVEGEREEGAGSSTKR